MKKNDLKRINYLHNEICKLELRIHEIESELTSIKSTSDFKMLVQESVKKSDYKEILIVEKNKILQQKKDLIVEFEKIREKLKKEIEKSDFTNLEKEILYNRYVFCLPWNRIKNITHYSSSYIFQVHNNVLKKIKRA